MKRRRNKRSPSGDRFVWASYKLLLSLPENEMAVLIAMARRHDGKNNGHIAYGARDAAKAAYCSPNTGLDILDALCQRRCIKLIRKGAFNLRSPEDSKASEWEIPFLNHKKKLLKEERKVKLYHWMLDSPAWLRLRPAGRKTLIEMMRRLDGGNNGRIEFGARDGRHIALGPDKT